MVSIVWDVGTISENRNLKKLIKWTFVPLKANSNTAGTEEHIHNNVAFVARMVYSRSKSGGGERRTSFLETDTESSMSNLMFIYIFIVISIPDLSAVVSTASLTCSDSGGQIDNH